MDASTRNRLVNLLARTGSEYDGEALAAVKKANGLLKRLRLAWSEVIPAGTPGPDGIPEPETQPQSPPEEPAQPSRPSGFGNDLYGEEPVMASSASWKMPPVTPEERAARLWKWLIYLSSGTICGGALWHEAISEHLGGNDVFFLTLLGFGIGALAAYLLVKLATRVKQARSHSEGFVMLAPLTFMQRLAWVCLVLGIGSGTLIAVVAIRVLTLEVLVPVTMLIPAVVFAGCSLVGGVLWFLFGGWIRRQRITG